MASGSATRPQIASPSIFSSTDDLQKIFAASMLSPENTNQKGLAAAMLIGQDARQAGQIRDYYDQVAAANQLQMRLSQQQDAADLLKEHLAKLPELVNAGVGVGSMPGMNPLFGGQVDPQTLLSSALVPQKRQAEIAELYARVAAHNATAADKWEIDVVTDANGSPTYQIKGKGANPQTLANTGVGTARSLPYPNAAGGGYIAQPPGTPPQGSVPPTGPRVPVPPPTGNTLVIDPSRPLLDQIRQGNLQHKLGQ